MLIPYVRQFASQSQIVLGISSSVLYTEWLEGICPRSEVGDGVGRGSFMLLALCVHDPLGGISAPSIICLKRIWWLAARANWRLFGCFVPQYPDYKKPPGGHDLNRTRREAFKLCASAVISGVYRNPCQRILDSLDGRHPTTPMSKYPQDVSSAVKPSFKGMSGEECELFVQGIRVWAFRHGKQRDTAWTADFVSTCLAGAALRWFDRLEPEVQEDWTLLRKAMLDSWPAEHTSSNVTIPTPAAAPPVPGLNFLNVSDPKIWTKPFTTKIRDDLDASHLASSSTRDNYASARLFSSEQTSSGDEIDEFDRRTVRYTDLGRPSSSAVPAPSRSAISFPYLHFPPWWANPPSCLAGRGRLHVGINDGRSQKKGWRKRKPIYEDIYVGATMDSCGRLAYTATATDALIVSYVPDYGNVFLTMENSDGVFCGYLGIVWANVPVQTGSGSRLAAQLTLVPTNGLSFASTSAWSQNQSLIGTKVWRVSKDGTVTANWIDADGYTSTLYPVFYLGHLYLAFDIVEHTRENRLKGDISANLRLDAL